MGFIEVITKLFGNKSQKDMRAVMPYVEKIKAVYAEIDALRVEFEASSTDVENVVMDHVVNQKVIENGYLHILFNGVKYNAEGKLIK